MFKAKPTKKAKMEIQYILVIENNLLNRSMLSKSLEQDGFIVQYADSTESGLAMLTTARPFLIILDINSPKLDARTFTRILKNDEDTKDIKILAFSDSSLYKSLAPFDRLIYTNGQEQLLLKGIRLYLVTMKTVISTIVFKNTAYENNY
ncbi:MAG: response regulator [Bacteroidota bacterium]